MNAAVLVAVAVVAAVSPSRAGFSRDVDFDGLCTSTIQLHDTVVETQIIIDDGWRALGRRPQDNPDSMKTRALIVAGEKDLAAACPGMRFKRLPRLERGR